MRKIFIKTLIELAEKDDKIFLLTGDLGSDFNEFATRFPGRFLNCGIAEQNMVGVAAGLALCGKKPYVYSIIPFVAMRALEQIRNDVCYQNLNVKIIGMGAGFNYGPLGATHHAIEDVAILRALPNMTIISPSDCLEIRELILQSYKKAGPTYIRMSKLYMDQENILGNGERIIELGRPLTVKEGQDGAIIASGDHVRICLNVAQKMKELGFNLKVVSLHTLKPINKNYLLKEIGSLKVVFTVEEHSLAGGLGSIILETTIESGWQGQLKRIGIQDEHSFVVGSVDYLRKKHLIDEEEIIKSVLYLLKNN